MRPRVLGFLSAALFLGSVALFNLKITELLDTGTCASGNQPFEIARPCPEGTGTDVLLMVASIFGIFIAGGLYLLRGDQPAGRRASSFPWPTFAWGFFFGVSGGFILLHSLTSDVIGPDGELGGIIVGVTFLVMGLPVLVYLLTGLFGRGRDRRSTVPASAGIATGAVPRTPRPAPTGAGGDRITELERLDRLRQSGALSQAEFEREKARVLGS